MITALAACGKKTEKTASEGQTVINWYMQKPIENMSNQKNVEAKANELISSKLDMKLKFTLIDVASWEQKAKLLSASGEPVDLIFTSSWSNKLSENVKRGGFLPLNDLLEEYGQDILKKVDPRTWEAVTFDGQIMAVPSNASYSSPQSYVFKKELVEKYNFDYENCKSLDDLEPFLQTLKENEPGITPLLVTANDGLPYAGGYTPITSGVVYDEESEKVVNAFSPENKPFYEYGRKMNEFYQKGYIAKDAVSKTEYTSEAKTGRYAVMHQAGSATEDGSKSTALYGFDCAESIVVYPRITTQSFLSAATAIPITCKQPEAAMQMLNLVWADPVISNTLAYGVEGEDYTVVSGAGTDNPSILPNEGSEQKWAIWHNFLGPLWDQWDSTWNTRESLEQMKAYNDKAQVSKLCGFTFEPDNVSTIVANVSSIITEANTVVNAGAMTDFEAYMADTAKRLEDAGIGELIKEAEKQINEWKATNNK